MLYFSRSLAWIAIGVLGLAVSACGPRVLPPDPPAAALYRDMQRLLAVQEAAGWQVDRFEIEDMMPDLLMSLCQVEPEKRAALLGWIDTRIAALGGPVEKAYAERGKDRDAVTDLLDLTRIRKALETAMAGADRDCPFWLEPKAEFAGRQISDDRWQITLGGGGRGILVAQGDDYDLQFGGGGRLLIGRNIGSRLTLSFGFEGGASASFPRDDGGDRGNLVVAFDGVYPVVARYRMLNTYAELEIGYLSRFTEDDFEDVSHGFHIGAAFGGRATRVRWFFPGAVFGIAYERVFEDGADLHMIKLGFRGALDFDW